MIQQGTDWNRHHGVGATLLENWVEERAVGDIVLEERSDLSKLSRTGHNNILTHSKDNESIQSTYREAFSALSRKDASKITLGKRRQLLEAELLKNAIAESDGKKVEPKGSKEWVSTTKEHFAHTDLYQPVVELGSSLPSKDLIDKYARPITFWTDFAAKGSGTAICSTPAAHLLELAQEEDQTAPLCPIVGHRAGQIHQHHASVAAIRFGKQPAFSTPIQYLKKGQTKE